MQIMLKDMTTSNLFNSQMNTSNLFHGHVNFYGNFGRIFGFWMAWFLVILIHGPRANLDFSSLIHGPREILDFFQLDPRPGEKNTKNARLGSQTAPKGLHGLAFPIFSFTDTI